VALARFWVLVEGCEKGGVHTSAIVIYSMVGIPEEQALDVTHVPSGKRYAFPYEGHLWVFNNAGKVTKYQHVTDTAQHQRMAKGE
jgi:hypothetical protein